MKYLSGVIFLMLANIASAVDCRVNGGFWLDVEVGGSLGLNVWTNVAFNASLDRVLLDGYTLECRHRASASSNPSAVAGAECNTVIELKLEHHAA